MAEPTKSAPVAGGIRILLVDASVRNLDKLESALARLECSVVKAHSGPAALEYVLAHEFAAIVLAEQMPGMDGFATASLIRAGERSSATPIILLTAHDRDPVQMMEGYHLGAVDFICEPFDPDRLRAKVAICIESFRMTAALEDQTAELARLTAALASREQQVVTLNAQLLDRSTELELASKHKSEFLTTMSHELRTPLNAIIGFSEIMLDHDDFRISMEQRRTFLDHIQSSGQHLLGLVNDILDLAKVEAGRMELRLAQVNLQALLVGCVDLIRALSDPKQLTVEVLCEPRDVIVNVDAARLKQILFNLLSNAVKFTPAAGQISVTAQVDASGAVISVRDSGIGVRPEDEDLVFQPFRQAAGRGKNEGTGLGLSLARELVELHGGLIWLAHGQKVGSCFSFSLPRALHYTTAPQTLASPPLLSPRDSGSRPSPSRPVRGS